MKDLIGPEEVHQRMLTRFTAVGVASFVVALITALVSVWFFQLGTPPLDGEALRLWLIAHQEQLMYQAAGDFYWTEIHTAILLTGFSAVALFSSLYCFQMLVVAKIARVTAEGTFASMK
jgi:hypothetical protein